MTKLTDNFSLEELSFSSMAVRKSIPNIPNEDDVDNLTILASKVLEPLREEINCPIRILSGYRCLTVNKLVGGSLTSQHMNGQAADIIPIGMDLKKCYNRIKLMIKEKRLVVDQCIYEFDSWIHISFTALRENRNEFLIAKKVHGVTTYTKDKV